MKLYVLVRSDLTKSQQAVQAGHSVAEWLINSPDTKNWRNGVLVYLSVDDEKHLHRWSNKLDDHDVTHVKFTEPDMDHQITALATLGNSDLFKSLRLM